MKKMKLFGLGLAILAFASCATAGDKAAGNYNGSYAIDSTATYPVSGTVVTGSINVTKVSESVVDMMLTCNSPSATDLSSGVSVTTSGNTVNFSYSKPTTTENDILSLNGTLTGNTITIDGVMYMSGGNGVGTFTGTK